MALKREFRGSSRKKSAASAAFDKENSSLSLITAVRFHDINSLRRLLSGGAKTEETNDKGETALILAAMAGDMVAMQLLIDSGANIDAKSNLSSTALMAAAQNGDIAAIRYLVSKGADIDARKKDGTTILMVAAMFGQAVAIDELIASGANIFAADVYGYTARMLAAGCPDCIEILSAAEARANELRDIGEVKNTEHPVPANVSSGTLKKALRAADKKSGKPRRAPKKKLSSAEVQSSV